MMQPYIRHEVLYICESPKSVNESESLCSLWVSGGTDRLHGTTGLLHIFADNKKLGPGLYLTSVFIPTIK